MTAIIAAFLFALAFVLHLVHASPPVILSPASLMYAGLCLTALHLAWGWYPWRRTAPAVPPQ